MALTTPSSAHTTFSLLMNLLPELRLKVYEHALATTGTLFRVDDDYILLSWSSAWHLKIFQGVALLCSSRKIYNEALPVFYAVNHFHFDPDAAWNICVRSTDLSIHTSMMRHICIGEFDRDFWPTDQINVVYLKMVLDMFPRLHSCSFYITEDYAQMKCQALNNTAKVLRDLRQRLRSMSIIYPLDDEDKLQGLRNVIAPHDEWQEQTCKDWPQFSMHRFHSSRIGPSGQIRVWNTSGRPVGRIEEL